MPVMETTAMPVVMETVDHVVEVDAGGRELVGHADEVRAVAVASVRGAAFPAGASTPTCRAA
jgi:hypothetical protein